MRCVSLYQSGSRQEAVLQVGQPSSAIRLAFDELQAVDMSFHRSCTVGKRQTRHNRRFVPLDTASKGEEFSHVRCAHVFEPPLKSLTAVRPNEIHEAAVPSSY